MAALNRSVAMPIALKSRDQLAQDLLGSAYEALTPVQRSVIDLVAAESPTGKNPILDERAFGDRLSDRVAQIGGSWGFIIVFAVILLAWMLLNSVIGKRAFDPYPFIFLNLLLSTLAAIQAPVIMMSQNRQSAKDREAAEHDYVVNLRAELEIMHLHDKLDAMRSLELEELIRRQNETLELLRAQVRRLSDDEIT